MGANRELNVIKVSDQEFLLAGCNGEAVHLAREAGSGSVGRTPFHDWSLDPEVGRGRLLRDLYDLDALTNPRWVETTFCGRQWVSMVTSKDDDPVYGRKVSIPTCRRCLALMDKLFPEPILDDRFPLVVQMVSDTVVEYGTAEILGVPGDHQAALRKEVRAEVRKRTGHGMETYAHSNWVVFVCQLIYDLYAPDHSRRAAEAIDAFLNGETVQPQSSPTRLYWDTWAVG